MKINRQLVLLALILIPLVSYNFMSAAWTAPSSSNKASSNTAAPIDVSSTAQVKTGGLSVGTLSVPGSASVQHLQVNGSLNTGANNINMAADTTLWNAGSMHISSERYLYLLPRNGNHVYVSSAWGGSGHLVTDGNTYTKYLAADTAVLSNYYCDRDGYRCKAAWSLPTWDILWYGGRYGDWGGTQYTSMCPAGYVVVGMNIRAARYVDQLELICGRLINS